jgi:hypothetical protein
MLRILNPARGLQMTPGHSLLGDGMEQFVTGAAPPLLGGRIVP